MKFKKIAEFKEIVKLRLTDLSQGLLVVIIFILFIMSVLFLIILLNRKEIYSLFKKINKV